MEIPNKADGNEPNYTQQIISLILRSWSSEGAQIIRFFERYPKEIYYQPIAPGRNTAWYILGHLTAIADAMLPLFFIGERLHPELAPFQQTPEKDLTLNMDIDAIKICFSDIQVLLAEKLKDLTPEEWMRRHALVSEEDFIKEPHRNCLNVLMSRSSHQRYHLGQLVLLSPSAVN
jgi:hypothetical protein